MKKYKNHINIFLGISLLLVSGGFTLLFVNFNKQAQYQKENISLQNNLIWVDSLHSNLLQIESEKQRYQFTSNLDFLKNMYVLKVQSQKNINDLKNHSLIFKYSVLINEIDSLTKIMIINLDNNISVFKTKGFGEAARMMSGHEIVAVKDLLHLKIGELKKNLLIKMGANTQHVNMRNRSNVIDCIIMLSLFIIGMFVAAFTFKKAQKKIIRNHIRFQEAQRIAKIGSWEWDIASNKVTWSKEMYNLFGEDPKTYKISFEGYFTHLSKTDGEITLKLLKETLDGKINLSIEHEIIRKDGSTIIVFEQGTVMYDEEGKPTGMFGTTQDITERRKADEKIKAERLLLRTVIDNLPDSIYVKNTNAQKIIANKTDMFLMGVENETDFLGKTDLDLFPTDEGANAYRDDMTVIQTGQSIINREEEFTDINGVRHNLLTSKVPFYNAESAISGLVGVGRDITERKKAEEDLISAQKKLQSIFDNTADGIYQSTVDGKFITANMAVAKLFGYDTPDELISSVNHIGEEHYANPEDRKKMSELLSLYGHIENYEVPLLTKNKDIVWVSESTRILRDEQSGINYFEGTLKDITERKRVEEELIKAQKKYKAIFDNTSVGIYQSSSNGNFIMVNPAMALIFGYDSPEDMLRTVTDIKSQIYVDPDERRKMTELISLYGHVEDFELQVLKKDKSPIWVSANIRIVKDEKEGINYFEGVLENITRRKIAEEQLLSMSDRLQLAVNATHIGIWDWNLVDDTTVWDDEMYEIYNVSPKDFQTIFKAWQSRVHPDDMQRVNEEIQKAIKGEKDYDTEFRIIWKDGTIHYVKGNALVQRDEQSNAIRMIGTNADITERKLAEEKILELNKSLDQFANITAHDLQEPIRMVSGFLGLLDKKYATILDDQGKSYIYRAKDGADRMSVLIKDLLEFSRSGNTSAKKEPVDLNEVMDLVKRDLSIVMEDTGASLCIPPSLPIVNGTQSALYRLLLNLISNGIKFRKKDTAPTVNLSVVESNGDWEFTLQDNGIGVPEKDQPKLFKAFQRLHRKEDYPGTGLGLVTCKKIVEVHDGKIWMTSEFGKGTAFHFTLPRNAK